MSTFSLENIGHLREVEAADLALVLEWRNGPKVRETIYYQHEIAIAEHRNWRAEVNNSRLDEYSIFEHY